MELGLEIIKTRTNLWTINQRIENARLDIEKKRPEAKEYIQGAIQSEDIRQQCFAILPAYAIPDKIFILKALPRLPNGKIDIQGLINNFIPQE